jgi:Zn-dependent protease
LTLNLYDVSVWVLPLVIAITFHEAAHGFVAHHFGDNTAWELGRVSFNPLKHIDPMGTLILPAILLLSHSPFLFGYAKPVPVNFRALRHPRLDMVWVALAGPATNIVLALFGGVSPGGLRACQCRAMDRRQSEEHARHQCCPRHL